MSKTVKATARKKRGGFTLIELLIVIAIIAILAVVVVITLNPAEMLRQARDSNRLSDLATLTSALNLYNTDQGGAAGYSLGSANVTYISIPDPTATTTAGTDCSGIGFPAGGAFHCAASSTFRNVNGTGWIPINLSNISTGAPLGNLPTDPINTTSSNEYYTYQTDGLSFKLRAVPESQKYLAQAGANQNLFIAGSNLNLGGGSSWVLVPGNGTFGTNNFYAMQYDAGCSDGEGNPINTPLDGQGYNNGGNSVNANNCTTANSRQIASISNSAPVVDVSHTQAITYCQSIGAHLMTNDEYMTIVTNAANQGSDWSNGSVGSGVMSRGNSNSSAAQWSGGSQYGTGYSDFTHLRTMTLSNGSVIWDMAGNVWEHVQRSSNNSGDNTNTITTPSCSSGSGWQWCQYGSSLTPYLTAWNDSSFSAATVGPPNNSWNTNQNVGEVYTDSGANGGTTVFLRGGLWDYGSSDGAFALYLWAAANTDIGVGFRCAR
ncbi:MAG: prepilin-type N-terminal cleavage/methylation domain-containing protein [Minisyncoccia bacterium]